MNEADRVPERLTPEEIARFEEESGLRFADRPLLEEALTHPSFVNEHPGQDLPDNQRLEFLGDAVLDLVVGEWLFRRFPGMQEGDLTNIRSHIVCTETLAEFAQQISLGEYLRLGKGELATGGAERQANLCGGFEAVVGAAYLDRGLEATREWVHRFLDARVEDIRQEAALRDAKSRLQELAQAAVHMTPSYRIVDDKGPDHAKVFTAEALLGGVVWGRGDGTTKQAAEQAAAEAALANHPELRAGSSPSAGRTGPARKR